MAEIVAGLLGLAIELGKCIVAPIKHQFIYLCCFNTNILSLREEAKKLEDERVGLRMEVDTATYNAQVIDAKVETWLKEVNEIQQKMSGLETEITNVQGGCSSVKSRYSISRRVVKTVETMKKKRELDRHNITTISHRPPPASMMPDILKRPVSEFNSREKIEKDIMSTLKDENVKIMGMCGMGGVGKTTLAEKTKNRVIKENVFGESVMVVVSQPTSKLKIQGEIAEKFGLKLEETSLSGRADRLCSRLSDGKRILIVLDDVWEYVDLKELGIPCQSGPGGCTIMLTSRNRSILARMDAQPIFVMETLTTTEAWSLFKEKLGTCANYQNWFSNLAQEIANECKGLPLAIVSVAGVLKDEENISVWKDALLQLRSSNPEDLSDVLKDVYTPIKLSYDYLSSKNARSIFLLCCLFPEDFDIPLEDLFAYALGLRMFEEIKQLEHARDKTCSNVEMLKSRFLLLKGREEGCVRMHDIVRDVAIFIASKEKWLIKCGDNSTWISPFLGERIELSNESNFPNLRLLMINNKQISDISFEGMKGLNVLSVSCGYPFEPLSHMTQFLKSLKTLILEKCPFLKTICPVGELINLEILICRDCGAIEELSSEIMRLKCLRLLEILNCEALQRIRPGVISSLDNLEELVIVRSFNRWEAENKEEKNENVGLSELEYLSNLTRLEIEAEDSNIAVQQISLPPKIEKYHIIIGYKERDYYYPREFGKTVYLHLPGEVTLGKWIHECVASAECFVLIGNGSNTLDLRKAKNARWLRFEGCSTASSVVRCGATHVVFPHLETMQLKELYSLEKICEIDVPNSELSSSSSSHNSFKNIKELSLVDLPTLKHLSKTSSSIVSLYDNLSSITVFHCERLLYLVPLSTTRVCFPQLELLKIDDCGDMEQVFSWKEEENNRQESGHTAITFPKLKRLELSYLPSLKVFYQGMESIEFPLLIQIQIFSCPQLKVVVPNRRGIFIGHDNHSSHVLCKEKASLRVTTDEIINNSTLCPQIPIGSFTHLQDLRIAYECGSMKSLFSFSMAQKLESLKILEISGCKEMEKVIEEDCSHESSTLCFPHLEELTLSCLPKLKIFCNSALGLPKLVYVGITDCPEIGGFILGSIATLESIESVDIWRCSMMEQVFLGRESSHHPRRITFPKLKILDLRHLPRLTSILKGAESVEFPLSTDIGIYDCPNLKRLVSTTSGLINKEVVAKPKEQTVDYSSLSIWEEIPIGSFTRLEDLRISDYDEIRSLFSSLVAANLINLKVLQIESCKNMVKVVDGWEVEEYSNEKPLLFPHLKMLIIRNLPKLKIFCDWKCALKLRSLERVDIGRGCPNMERFSLGSDLTTPNLKTIQIDYVRINIAGNLNEVLQQSFIRLKVTLNSSSTLSSYITKKKQL